jgi:uncharacterized membrane protein YjjP (DUF1212 family)
MSGPSSLRGTEGRNSKESTGSSSYDSYQSSQDDFPSFPSHEPLLSQGVGGRGAFLSPRTIDDEETQKKNFIFSLVVQLHKAGNFSFRTEAYVMQVATAFQLHATCAVLPVSAMISFQKTTQLNPHSSEVYNIAVSSGYDCSKLSRLDQLCYEIQQGRRNFQSAKAILADIEAAVTYPWYTVTLASGVASFSATLLFFGGTFRDGCGAFILGILVNLCGNLCSILPGLAEVECFISPFIVALVTSFVDKFLSGALCLYGMQFGAIVWLLPGITITIALLELFSKMIVYGSSRLIYGILLATQLGFGLSGGYKLIYPDNTLPESFEHGCPNPLPAAFGIVLLPLAVGAMGVIINADVSQLPGMIFCGGVGHLVSYSFHYFKIANADNDAIPVVAALIVTIAARLYAHYTRKRPLVYIIGGLLILVPGGVGVRGMSDVWSGNVQSGLDFTFRMVLIGVCLATGVFLALLPRRSWIPILDQGNDSLVLNTKTEADSAKGKRENYSMLESVKLRTKFSFYDPPESAKDCAV